LTSWQHASAGVVAPPGTGRVTVELTGISGVPGDNLYLDDIVVVPVTSTVDTDTMTFEGSTGHWVPWFSSTIVRSPAAHGGNYGLAIDVTAPHRLGRDARQLARLLLLAWAQDRRLRREVGCGERPGRHTVRRLAGRGRHRAPDRYRHHRLSEPVRVDLASADVTAPPGTARVTVELSSTSGAPGDEIYVDDLVFLDRTTATPVV